MFQVRLKTTGQVVSAFAVTRRERYGTWFLIWRGCWEWVDAQICEPMTADPCVFSRR